MKIHENLWNCTEILIHKNIHRKNTENHTENLSLLFKYWSLHFANHTEKYCAVL